MTAPVWLTIDEVAELLGRPRDTVRGWIARKKNKLPSELRHDDPTKRSVRMVTESDALAYRPPTMGGYRTGERSPDLDETPDYRDDIIRALIVKQKEGWK